MRRLPMYDVSPRFLIRGVAAGIATAAAGGLAVHFVPRFGWFFALLLGGLFGVLVAGAVSRATNYKRGSSLGWATVASIFLGYSLGRAILAYILFDGLQLFDRLQRALTVGLTPDLGHLLFMAMAAFIAFNRLR
jgi:hypothetical protein